jgi:hypothetical protein
LDTNDDWEPGQRPLAFPSQDSRGLSYDSAVERTEAAFAAARSVLADRPVLDTVGDLADMLAQLPREMPLLVDDQVSIDRTLSHPGDNPVFTVVASMATVTSPPLLPVRDNHGHEHDVLEPALELGTQVLPTAESAAAAETRPYRLPDRIADALDRGEIGEFFTLLARQYERDAGHLTGRAGEYLPGDSTPEMAAIAATLRDVAGRLTTHAPIVEHLILHEVDDEDSEDQT